MSVQAVLLPVFVQVALVFALGFWLGGSRLRAARRGEIKVIDQATLQAEWPRQPTLLSNCFKNQFEAPVLFYALVALAMITRQTDLLFVILSWVFVVSRLGHAAIFTTSNKLSLRFGFYLIGILALVAMWIIFAIRILAA
ncbi:MAPEG family protein [Oceanibaculum pacificum]|uniref:MAPEG family protein n=1 Tax=Oceanibaculum pacificum TaxID=580166 RepID=A0A154VZU0_9PROT|nr:MAPEG family protein [Oceanibaculum pacificum]KZD06785.1 hypothetical protein AUP43_10630 [Oceanibaculum pacificum]